MKLASRVLVPALILACLGAPAPAKATPAVAPQATPQVTLTLQLKRPGALSSKWTRIAKIGYGSATSKLGTSPGGDNVLWGPDYGVQVPDKTWWYVDAAKFRFAHYSDAGTYLGQVKLPKKYRAQGQYFQWADPMALSDGTVVLTSTTIGSPAMLLLSPRHTLSKVTMARQVWFQISSGTRLFGFDEDGAQVKVNPRTGSITTVTSATGQGGHTFNVVAKTGYVEITRPGVNLHLNLVDPDHPTATVSPAVEVAMSANGKLWLLVTAISEVSVDETYDLDGLFTVSTTGTVSAVSRVRTWYSDSDPGDGYHLGMRYGGTHPTLMFIDTDAVRVYRRK